MPLAATPALPPLPSLAWDIFCRVIDNHGDLGVCWRLAADLAARGHRVRLWLDDDRALAWMAPGRPAGVEVLPWTGPAPALDPGDVVIEAFGCNPPEAFVARMAAAARPPVWINLEYLSAEDYVARSHRLASPQWSGPGKGLTKWFFYPGFTPDTGGLLREPAWQAQLQGQDGDAFLRTLGIVRRPSERLVSLFCYANPAVAALPTALVDALADAPTGVLTTPGHATEQMAGLPLPAGVRTLPLPWLAQPDYDRLLHACDLNFVRGEDSFVRAQWAGRPFVWQIYPQHDGVHAGKLDAFLQRHLADVPAPLGPAIGRFMRAWNGLLPGGSLALPALEPWQAHARNWREGLMRQPDLLTQLFDFVTEKR